MPSVNPSVAIDLREFGKDGRMIVDEPTLERLDRLQRTILRDLFTEQQRTEYLYLPTRERAEYFNQRLDDNIFTAEMMGLMSYIREIPIDIGTDYYDYDAFMEYATKGMIDRIRDATEELHLNNPFALMNTELDIELGVSIYKDAFINGTNDRITSYFVIYGQYLANGGRKEDWMRMTETDITLMAMANIKTTERNIKNLAVEISNAIGKSMSGNTME